MVFVGLFLKSIFLILLLSAFFFIGIILYLYVRAKQMTKTFNYKRTNDGKFFGKDEGEYVDFEEENN